MIAAADRGRVEEGGVEALVSGCRQRFGWTRTETELGILVGRAMGAMNLAVREAGAAGVDSNVISSLYRTFGNDVIVGLQLEGLELAAGSQNIVQQAAARVAGRDIAGEAATKATRAVVLALIATRIVDNFKAELRANDGR